MKEQRTILNFKVIPNASKTVLSGIENGQIKIRLNATPEKGKANTALIAFLAEKLKIPKSAITILSGKSSRQKK